MEVCSGRLSLGDATDVFERTVIQRGLENANFNQTRAAELLGTTRRILKYKIDKLGIQTGE
jgi:transcriptional regulator with GAF, ATPase, and Fis domain